MGDGRVQVVERTRRGTLRASYGGNKRGMRGKERGEFEERSDGWSVRKADCKRLNDNATVFEITLHVQSSACWWSEKEGRWQSMYGSGLTQTMEGTARHLVGRMHNWPLMFGVVVRVILGTRVHLRRRNPWKQKSS